MGDSLESTMASKAKATVALKKRKLESELAAGYRAMFEEDKKTAEKSPKLFKEICGESGANSDPRQTTPASQDGHPL